MSTLFEALWEWFVVQPGRLVTIGSVIFGGGATMILVGLWGRIAMAVTNGMSQLTKTLGDASLTSIYPSLPTWWIPEGAAGFLMAAILVAIGFYLVYVGRKLERLMRHNT